VLQAAGGSMNRSSTSAPSPNTLAKTVNNYFWKLDAMKKLRGLVLMLLISLSLFGLTACQDGGNNATYEQITPQQAKEIMDTEQEYIIIDARTEEEFAEGHIENAILIPEYEIKDRAEKELPDKDALILVYCRSGRRSKIASEELVKLGYTNVKEFGGIIDWPYEVVK
jgi:rhodanese-related sulfurtransferase